MLGESADRRIPKLSADAVGVVVVDVFAEKASKVSLVQDDHVIQHLSARLPTHRVSRQANSDKLEL